MCHHWCCGVVGWGTELETAWINSAVKGLIFTDSLKVWPKIWLGVNSLDHETPSYSGGDKYHSKHSHIITHTHARTHARTHTRAPHPNIQHIEDTQGQITDIKLMRGSRGGGVRGPDPPPGIWRDRVFCIEKRVRTPLEFTGTPLEFTGTPSVRLIIQTGFPQSRKYRFPWLFPDQSPISLTKTFIFTDAEWSRRLNLFQFLLILIVI